MDQASCVCSRVPEAALRAYFRIPSADLIVSIGRNENKPTGSITKNKNCCTTVAQIWNGTSSCDGHIFTLGQSKWSSDTFCTRLCLFLHPKGAFTLAKDLRLALKNVAFGSLPSELKLWNLWKRTRNKGRGTRKWSNERSWLVCSPFGCKKKLKKI